MVVQRHELGSSSLAFAGLEQCPEPVAPGGKSASVAVQDFQEKGDDELGVYPALGCRRILVG
jgi:hypothetical protein